MVQKVGFYFSSEEVRCDLSDMPDNIRLPLAAYLKSGVQVAAVPSICIDLLEDNVVILNGDSLLTDGEWVWPCSLPFYVEKYCVMPSADFLAHVRASGWSFPNLPPNRLDEVVASLMNERA